jgi:predicted ATPase/DNA-binding winged helix-turn-helix (wHTH) protein
MAEQAGCYVYRFGRCELQPSERRLLISGEPAAITPRAFDVLLTLVERAGQLVTKDQLLEIVWPRLVVEDNNLQQQVSSLRRMLGAEAIDTVPGRGYRFALEPRRVAPARVPEPSLGNLPRQLTSFIGREREVGEAGRLLQATRLLTLVGMGGIGKTRLALELAAGALPAYPDGAWFLDLASIRDPSHVASQAAQILGVEEAPGRQLLTALCAFARERTLLLVLDNCEHLIDACADLANTMLRSAPGLRIVATSREALRVPGEQIYSVLPMRVPARRAQFDAMASCDAVQLFVERTRLHRPDFVLTEQDAPAVAELCARLEGIPLALELAAARMRTLSIVDINRGLSDRFSLLTRGDRVLIERQRTLRALVDWSYELLQPDERVLCDRLGVFAGGFEIAAAEAICGHEPLASADIVDLLASLVDKSLLMAEQRDDSTRYRMLETIRDYAREKLHARGEATATAVRHCNHFLSIAKAANEGLKGVEQRTWAERLEAEIDNMRAAIAFALKGGVDPIVAVKFQVALLKFRLLRGYVTEGVNDVNAALALPAVRASPVAHAHALYVGAGLARSRGEYAEAARLLEACLVLRCDGCSRVDFAATLSTLALVRLEEGDAVGAREREEEALGIFRELGDRIGEAIGLLHLGQIEMYVGDNKQARRRFQACFDIARAIRHSEIESECERMLGELALEEGDVAGARQRFVSSLQACREAGDKRDEAISLWWIARTDIVAGERSLAREKLEQALAAFADFDMKFEMIGCLEDFAGLAQADGDAKRAVWLYAAASAARERQALALTPRAERRRREAVATAQRALPEPDFQAANSAGRDWRLGDAVLNALGATTAPMFAG